MSSASTAERPPGVPDHAGTLRSADAGGPVVAPRSAGAGAAGAEEDRFRWRGLSGPGPGVHAVLPARATAAEDQFPWRGLRPSPPYPSSPPASPSADAGPGSGAASNRVGRDVASVIVIGLGNPILGDDGVGWRVADLVEARLGIAANGVRVERAALGGLALMERLVGARYAILVDAMETGAVPVGTVTCMTLDDVGYRPADHLDSAHDTPLTVALAAGRALGADLPAEVHVVAVEARHVDTFSDDLSPEVAAAVPAAADAVLDLLDV
jgi:hydrogenase maturation protease